MIRIPVVPIAIVLAMTSCSAPEDSFLPDKVYRLVEEREVADGLVYREMASDSLRQQMHVVTVDLNNENIGLDLETSNDELLGFETTSQMFARLQSAGEEPLVAVNADFWHADGAPVGMFVDDGQIWRGPWRGVGDREGMTRTVMAFNDEGQLYFGLPDFHLDLTLPDGDTIEIGDVNLSEGGSLARAYTHDFSLDSLRVAVPAAFVFSSPDTSWLPNVPLRLSYSGSLSDEESLNPGEVVVSVSEDDEAKVAGQSGGEFTLSAAFENLHGRITGAVGALPRLIDVIGDSVVVDPARFAAEEGVFAKFVTDLHPRTALGYDLDTRMMYLVVVDGRSDDAVGMDLVSLADMFKNWGCEYAINFDGGGSTTMVVAGEIVNRPSDSTGERPVSNVLVVRGR